jgi:hypothetical protein
MKSVGVFIQGKCLVYIYPSSEKVWKFRSTSTIKRAKKDGSTEDYVFRSEGYSSIQETIPFVCRFIKRQYDMDLNLLTEGDVEFRKVPYTGRVSPTDVPAFMAKKFDAFLAADPSIAVATGIDVEDDEDEAVAPTPVAETIKEPGDLPPAAPQESIF